MNERLMKESIEKATAGAMLGGAATPQTFDNQNQCAAAPSMRDRIYAQRFQAQKQARNADRLMELEYLLDKHPEVARILELLELTR